MEPSSPRATGPAEPKWLRPAILALAALCLLGLFSTEIGDSDTWWHLKTGQYILQHHSLPVPDPFSYTTNLGKPAYPGEEQVRRSNLTHEWLAQAIWYAVYAVAGVPGVVLFRALLLAALCGITGLVAGGRSRSFYAGLTAAFAAAAVAIQFASDRPAILTFLLVAVFIAIFEFRRPLWLLPPLALFWANCHGGFFLGWIVAGAYSAEAAVLSLRKRPVEDARRIWLASAAAVAISALNPNGFRVLETLFRYRNSYLTSTLIEWMPPSLWGPPYAFVLLLYAAALILLLAWRKVRISDWLLFAAFAAAALSAYRNTMLIGIVAPVLIAAWFPWRFRLPADRFAGPVAILMLLLGLIAGVVRGGFFELRAALWKYPSGACDFLQSHAISGPIFNTYEYGGYLIWRLWPQQRVFVDGRALNESVYRDYQSILNNAGSPANMLGDDCRRLLDHYGVRVIVINTFEYVTGNFYALPLALSNPATTDWKLIYEDPQSLIFVRDLAPNVPELEKARRNIDHMEAECTLHIGNDPAYPLCARTLGDLSLRAGDKERALRMLGLYLAHAGQRDPSAEQALRNLMAQ